MERLIDVDALLKDITHRYCENCERRKGIKNGKKKFVYDIGDAPCRACAIDDMIDELENAPTVDAVEVVRCKDCIYSSPFDEEELKYPYRVGEWQCEYWGYAEMHEDDYCSCGKRRKDETDS